MISRCSVECGVCSTAMHLLCLVTHLHTVNWGNFGQPG